jgi:hypothetical protein
MQNEMENILKMTDQVQSAPNTLAAVASKQN